MSYMKSVVYTISVFFLCSSLLACTKTYTIEGEIDGCSAGQDSICKVVVLPIGKVLTENIQYGYFTIDSLLEGDYTVQCFVKRPRYNTTSWKIIGDSSFTYTIPITLKEDIRLMVRENYRSRNKYQFYLPLHRNEQDSTCPICKMDDEIIPILYGLIIPSPTNDKQLQKYRLGGCMVRNDRWYCERDKIEF